MGVLACVTTSAADSGGALKSRFLVTISDKLKIIGLLTLTSLLGACCASAFIHSLMLAVHTFQNNWHLLSLAAPVVGIILAQSLVRWEFNLVILWLNACASHLVGISVGREGAAVQISQLSQAWLVEKLGKIIELKPDLLDWLTRAAVTAGFTAIFLTPWAGLLFGLETGNSHNKLFHEKTKLPLRLLTGGLAAWIGNVVGAAMRTPHWHPDVPTSAQILTLLGSSGPLTPLALKLLLAPVLLIALGLFYRRAEALLVSFTRSHISLQISLPISGLMITIFTHFIGRPLFNNLGLPLLEASLRGHVIASDFFLKLLFLLVSLAGGWLGGFFVPLMSLGGISGTLLAKALGLMPMFGALPGVFALIAARARVPLTCLALSWEMFGWPITVQALPATLLLMAWDWRQNRL